MCLKNVVVTPGVISLFICGDKGRIKLERLFISVPMYHGRAPLCPSCAWSVGHFFSWRGSFLQRDRANSLCYLEGMLKNNVISRNF